MTKHTIELKAEQRTETGKAEMRRMRRLSGNVPGVVCGAGKKSQSIVLEHNTLLKLLEQEAFHSQVITLIVGGRKESVVLKEVQFYPGKPKVLHVDFQRIKADEKLTIKIPLHFVGEEEAPGVKASGGVISHNLSEVEVKCLPADLPESITIDVSKMELNQVLHLTDIALPDRVELVALAHGAEDHDLPVASIHLPTVIKEPSEEEASEEATEGEVADKEQAEPAEQASSDADKSAD